MTLTRPWHGVLVASALPLRDDLSVDHDDLAGHVDFLANGGCDGIVVNGSLGEYQTLTDDERAAVVTTAIGAAPPGFQVMAGVGAYGADGSVRWAEQAARAGASSLLCLPPNAYRADDRAVVEHYRAVVKVGLPVVAYNNPYDTKVDLTPELLTRLYGEGLIVAVKEFSGDPRRPYQIAESAPGLDVLIGADDVVLELAIAGAVGWVAGYPNAFPRSCVDLYQAAVTRDLDVALPLYRTLHPLLRWDSKTEFVQAIKLSMDMVGRHGGSCRQPRQPLTDDQEAVVRTATQAAIDAGLS
jgi:4-hydroxy-tetrahydrodipicolinate synthase